MDTNADIERRLAPWVAAMVAENRDFSLADAIGTWTTHEGLDALREELVGRRAFDTEALRVIARQRARIGGRK
jgi:hypothetical protein